MAASPGVVPQADRLVHDDDRRRAGQAVEGQEGGRDRLRTSCWPGRRESEEGPRPSLKVIAGLYLDEAKATKRAGDLRAAAPLPDDFCEHVGNKKVPDLRVHHVTDWLKANSQWGGSTQGLAVSLVTACMNWAVSEQRIAKNPLKGIRRKKTKRAERTSPRKHLHLILTKGPGARLPS